MSGTYRYGRTYCQVAGCHRRAERCVEVDLPISWDGARETTALTVVVGLCRAHGHDVARRVQALLEARSDYAALLAVIEMATIEDGATRAHVEELEHELALAQGAVRYHTDRAERADRDLVEAEGAVSYQRERADRAEAALRVVDAERAKAVRTA